MGEHSTALPLPANLSVCLAKVITFSSLFLDVTKTIINKDVITTILTNTLGDKTDVFDLQKNK